MDTQIARTRCPLSSPSFSLPFPSFLMRKFRGSRLGKRMVRVWRWVCGRRRRRRLKNVPYRPLTHPAPPPPPSPSPHLYRQHRHKTATAVKAKITDWGRSLTRRFKPSSSALRSRRGGRAGGEEDDHLLPPRLDKGEKRLHRPDLKKQPLEEEWWKPPPKGHLAVYVGRKGVEPPRRVLVPVVYFNHPLFGELLQEVEEEFGFHHAGGITIPCPVADFESIRRQVAAAAGEGGSSRSGRATRCRH